MFPWAGMVHPEPEGSAVAARTILAEPAIVVCAVVIAISFPLKTS